jgi:hypothetical protein
MRSTVVVILASCAAAALASPAWGNPKAPSVYSPWTIQHPKLPRAERKAVNRTINAFVLHAVRHKNPGAAYKLVSMDIRDGMTRKQFARHDPVYPFPARGTKFPWTLQYVDPGELGGTLFLQPRHGAKTGPILFDIRLTKHHGRWLIASLVPAVSFGTPTKVKVRSVRDYSPQTAMGGGTDASSSTTTRSRVSGTYAVIPFAVLGTLLVGLAGWGLTRWYRYRRFAASVRSRDVRARASL